MENVTLHDLKTRLTEVSDLSNVNYLLGWDQSTYMPEGGGDARARQMALLGRLAHERFIDPAIGRLLDSANGDLSEDDAALIRLVRRQYERAIRVPAAFVAEMEAHLAKTYNAWTAARPANDFARMRPLLERTLEFSRRYAAFFPHAAHPIDAFIEEGDYGMTAETVARVFAELRAGLVPLVSAIAAAPPISDQPLRRGYSGDAQLAFGLPIIRAFGYDFARGRQDLTHHPFMTKFSNGDVRITTRFREDDLGDALFSTLHEAGHALYEQGINPAYDGLPLDSGTSNGVHESQSRLWENLVGRSEGFWTHTYPSLQTAFPTQLSDVSLDQFYRAINRVQPSLVRVDADEVTYNLHVMIRFDLEMQLLDGRLSIAD